MRILLAHHFPLDVSPSGRHAKALATALAAQGHEVRVLVVTQPDAVEAAQDGRVGYSRVTCRTGDPRADLDFELPSFADATERGTTFASLSEAQLAAYRDALRLQLDRDVDAFNPHIIHAEHVWLWGQLALEAGVPYVLSVWGPELDAARLQPGLRGLAQQAAENAGRIVAPDAATVETARRTLEVPADRFAVLGGERFSDPARHVQIYRDVLEQRFGTAAPL